MKFVPRNSPRFGTKLQGPQIPPPGWPTGEPEEAAEARPCAGGGEGSPSRRPAAHASCTATHQRVREPAALSGPCAALAGCERMADSQGEESDAHSEEERGSSPEEGSSDADVEESRSSFPEKGTSDAHGKQVSCSSLEEAISDAEKDRLDAIVSKRGQRKLYKELMVWVNRDYQSEAVQRCLLHFNSDERETPAGIYLAPGLGKTRIMEALALLTVLLPFDHNTYGQRALVIVPNRLLRTSGCTGMRQLLDTLIQKGLHLSKSMALELVASSTPKNKLSDQHVMDLGDQKLAKARVVYANWDNLKVTKVQKHADLFDLICVDEGHHIEAADPQTKGNEYHRRLENFKRARKVLLTGSNFRTKGQVLPAKPMVERSREWGETQDPPLVKVSHACFLDFPDTDHTGDHAKIRKNILYLAEITMKAVRHQRRISGKHHVALAIVNKYEFGLTVESAFKGLLSASDNGKVPGPVKVRYIHSRFDNPASSKTGHDNNEAIQKLIRDELDVMVQVRKLSEGFSYDSFSIVTYFQCVGTDLACTQTFGRASRLIKGGEKDDQKAFAIVWKSFKTEKKYGKVQKLSGPEFTAMLASADDSNDKPTASSSADYDLSFLDEYIRPSEKESSKKCPHVQSPIDNKLAPPAKRVRHKAVERRPSVQHENKTQKLSPKALHLDVVAEATELSRLFTFEVPASIKNGRSSLLNLIESAQLWLCEKKLDGGLSEENVAEWSRSLEDSRDSAQLLEAVKEIVAKQRLWLCYLYWREACKLKRRTGESAEDMVIEATCLQWLRLANAQVKPAFLSSLLSQSSDFIDMEQAALVRRKPDDDQVRRHVSLFKNAVMGIRIDELTGLAKWNEGS